MSFDYETFKSMNMTETPRPFYMQNLELAVSQVLSGIQANGHQRPLSDPGKRGEWLVWK